MENSLVISPIPAFQDNYFWLLVRGDEAVVVDPGDAEPVEAELSKRQLKLSAILITHHHPDHIGGLEALLSNHSVPVYGPKAESKTIPLLSVQLVAGDTLEVLGKTFEVIEVPGHTLGHIAFFAKGTDLESPLLLCGDTLFSAGCGRLFEGTPKQMHASLNRLAELPGATQVYCTHEYTMANLAFAHAVEPDNHDLAAYIQKVKGLRARNKPSLPTSMELELRINPFLRADQPAVRAAASRHADSDLHEPVSVFACLRAWKDNFKGPAL